VDDPRLLRAPVEACSGRTNNDARPNDELAMTFAGKSSLRFGGAGQ